MIKSYDTQKLQGILRCHVVIFSIHNVLLELLDNNFHCAQALYWQETPGEDMNYR